MTYIFKAYALKVDCLTKIGLEMDDCYDNTKTLMSYRFNTYRVVDRLIDIRPLRSTHTYMLKHSCLTQCLVGYESFDQDHLTNTNSG